MSFHAAHSDWRGSFTDGIGSSSLNNGLAHRFTAHSRFSGNPEAAANPENYLAAALASSFSMSLALEVSEAGYKSTDLSANAEVQLEQSPTGFEVAGIKLECTAIVPKIEEDEFELLVRKAAQMCPITRTLNTIEIEFDVSLKAE